MNIEIYELSAKKINDILKAIRGVKILASPAVIYKQVDFIEDAVKDFLSTIKGLDGVVKELESKVKNQAEFISNQGKNEHDFRNSVQKVYSQYELKIRKLEAENERLKTALNERDRVVLKDVFK